MHDHTFPFQSVVFQNLFRSLTPSFHSSLLPDVVFKSKVILELENILFTTNYTSNYSQNKMLKHVVYD